jgi:hypothetical protein
VTQYVPAPISTSAVCFDPRAPGKRIDVWICISRIFERRRPHGASEIGFHRPAPYAAMILSGCRGWRSRPWGIRTDTLQPVVWPNTPANARIEPSIFSWSRKQKGSPPGGWFPFDKWLNGALNRNQACLRQIVSAGKRCLPVAISRGAASQSLVVSTQVWKCGACLWCSKACSLV